MALADKEVALSDTMPYDDQDDTIRCTLCGDATYLSDLCSCCHRCIDCISECGHRRIRNIADEYEFYEEPNGQG